MDSRLLFILYLFLVFFGFQKTGMPHEQWSWTGNTTASAGDAWRSPAPNAAPMANSSTPLREKTARQSSMADQTKKKTDGLGQYLVGHQIFGMRVVQVIQPFKFRDVQLLCPVS